MFLIIIVILLTVIYLYIKSVYSYWRRHGFNEITPSIPFGNLDAVRTRERSFGCAIYDLYRNSTKRMVGIYLIFRPALLIRDAELVSRILTKDFNYFHDRGVYLNEHEPLTENLLALEGYKWKTLRAKLTPLFSSGKIKNMFSTSTDVAKQMEIYLNSILPDNKLEGKIVEMKDVTYRYAVDIIASTIFGLDVNSFKDMENEFFMIKDLINRNNFGTIIGTLTAFLCPQLAKFIPISITGRDKVQNFMVNIVKQTIDYREKNNVTRKDLMQSLIQLRNTGKVNDDDNVWNVETAAENLKSLTYEQCAAQAFLFYIAGLETTAATLSFLLHELTQNEEVYVKLQKNIDEILEKNDGQITYESIQEMTYLDACINETIRKYPGLPMLNRICTKDYYVESENIEIKKGTPIIISLLGLHMDEKLFPEPHKFYPERFMQYPCNYKEAAYLPFGDGPRHCIAVRMGKVNVKIGAVMMLQKFKFEAIEKKEIEFDNFSLTLMPKGGINLKVSKK